MQNYMDQNEQILEAVYDFFSMIPPSKKQEAKEHILLLQRYCNNLANQDSLHEILSIFYPLNFKNNLESIKTNENLYKLLKNFFYSNEPKYHFFENIKQIKIEGISNFNSNLSSDLDTQTNENDIKDGYDVFLSAMVLYLHILISIYENNLSLACTHVLWLHKIGILMQNFFSDSTYFVFGECIRKITNSAITELQIEKSEVEIDHYIFSEPYRETFFRGYFFNFLLTIHNSLSNIHFPYSSRDIVRSLYSPLLDWSWDHENIPQSCNHFKNIFRYFISYNKKENILRNIYHVMRYIENIRKDIIIYDHEDTCQLIKYSINQFKNTIPSELGIENNCFKVFSEYLTKMNMCVFWEPILLVSNTDILQSFNKQRIFTEIKKNVSTTSFNNILGITYMRDILSYMTISTDLWFSEYKIRNGALVQYF
jgi:hypothetical protein